MKVFDINGDGQLEIVAQNDNQYVYVFDSKTGAILFEVKTTFPPGWSARTFNGPEVAIVNGDGQVRLVVANSAATITSYRFDPLASTGVRFSFVKEWERRLTACHSNPGMDSKPVLADLDFDGRLEILAATEESGVYALRDDGRIYWGQCIGGGNAEPTVGDLDQDGWPEVVFGSDAGMITAMNGRTGRTLWNFSVLSRFALGSGSIPVGVAIGQLDGVDGLDVVAGARDSHDADNFSNDRALLLALSGHGTLLWGRQDPGGNPLTYTHPIIADAAGDGANEVYWADWNTIGHKPPFDPALAWRTTGPAHFYRYEADGTLAWRQSLPTWWSNKDIPIADVDADGVQEMLANGPDAQGHDGIWFLDTRTGAKEAFVDVDPWKVMRAPVVADLWGTGTMQFVIEASGNTPSAGGPAILVYDTGAPYSSIWPHLPYPSLGGSPPPPPPPGSTFNATFTIKAPNEWWQELYVTPDTPRTITSAEVRIDQGLWKPMKLASWGAWTSSYNSPRGISVEFRATDAGGLTSTSEPFTWLDGTLSRRSVGSGSPPPPPPPPPPGNFSPMYEVPKSVNEWWVEVAVGTSEPLARVEARVNAGDWKALDATSWGTWAKSFFVARGSAVQFRATTTYGAQNVSKTFTWLTTGPPDPTFNATFSPRAVGNDWWVEVVVTANHPLAKVEANVNNGNWILLDKTTWGSWAKSFFVANGSQVRFRATDDAGASIVSAPTTWT